jgi:hypothetical protein
MSQPSRPTLTKSIQGTHKPKRRRNLAVLLVICVVIVGGVFGYKHIQKDRAIAKEHAEYTAAEADLNNLADQIVAKFGRPADRKELKACGYTSVEFGRGALYCNVDINVLYGTSSLANSIELAKNIEGSGLKGGRIKQEFDPTIQTESIPPVSIFVESFDSNSLNCSVEYSHHLSDEELGPPDFANLSFGNSKEALLIDMNCNARFPRAVYYPVTSQKE